METVNNFQSWFEPHNVLAWKIHITLDGGQIFFKKKVDSPFQITDKHLHMFL